ncbi:MAG: hypothetical protein ACRD0J_13105, partial [Acidimicrobiales bacterium]
MAMGLHNASQIVEYSPVTKAFGKLALPPGMSVNSLAFTSSGELVAGLSDYRTGFPDTVETWTAARVPSTRSARDSAGVTADYGVIVSGTSRPTVFK